MRRQGRLALVLLWISVSLGFAQKPPHFYNVDKEIRVEGTIQEIIMEPRYEKTAPFLVVILQEKETKKRYIVELSPVWFFEHDFHKGEDLVIVGSLYQSEENTENIIAREVQFRGQILLLRDKHGFPNWRGGQMKREGRRKGKRY